VLVGTLLNSTPVLLIKFSDLRLEPRPLHEATRDAYVETLLKVDKSATSDYKPTALNRRCLGKVSTMQQ
jgi:hypothetical protein